MKSAFKPSRMSLPVCWLGLIAAILAGCASPAEISPPPAGPGITVLAAESFLADITQQVAGDRLKIESLAPLGVDPHALELTPRDAARLADADVLVINGAGLESWLDPLMNTGGSKARIIEASQGISPRSPLPGEPVEPHDLQDEAESEQAPGELDPHFWLDPTLVFHYVENIRQGLTQADPGGEAEYAANAAAYILELEALDAWILDQVAQIPQESRLLATNHESFGYYADRYGFRLVGVVLPSPSSLAAPSAAQMTALIEAIRSSGARAIFLETGSNPELAEQAASETGVKVISGLFTHSLSPASGPAPSYLEMMRYNTRLIVEALKP